MQWGILAAGLLAGGMLMLHDQQQHLQMPQCSFASVPVLSTINTEPVYTLPEVLDGWHRQPRRWEGRTVLVRTLAATACELSMYDRAEVPSVPGSTCRPALSGAVMLFGGGAHVAIPAYPAPGATIPTYEFLARSYPPGATIPPADPTAVLRVRLVSRPDCGPLGLGRHPCLYADQVERAGN